MIVSNNAEHVNYSTADVICGSDLPRICTTGKVTHAGPPNADNKFNPVTQVKYKAKFGGKCKYCGRYLSKSSWIYGNQSDNVMRWCCEPRCAHLLVLDPHRMYR